MVDHIKYHKIHTSLVHQRDDDRDIRHQWCVSEKVHGANLSIYVYRSGNIRCGKRTGPIKDSDNFFGYYEVVERLRDRMWKLADALLSDLEILPPSADPYVTIFGELFGGGYPNTSNKPVQTGIWYSPRLEFMLFDICVPKRSPGSTSPFIMHYLPFSEALTLAAEYDIFSAQPLFTGSKSEALSYPLVFSSTIPARLGNAVVPGVENNAEGIVIRPLHGAPFPCSEGNTRAIMKLKTIEFRDGDGCPQSQGREQEYLQEWLLSLATDVNLITSASSKVGSLEERDNWNGIVDCVLQDIVDECSADSNLIKLYDEMLDKIKYNIFKSLASS